MSRDKKIWRKISTTEIFKTRLFRFRSDQLRTPDDRVVPHYYVMDPVDWVNIVALTPKQEVILIRQYRHGIEDHTIEIPGGAVDPQETEGPEAAAKRELTEETGYVPQQMILLNPHRPNPALQSNRLWTFLALGCEKKQEQNLDEFEDIEVFLEPVSKIREMVKSGEITHSLVIAAFYLAEPHFEKGPQVIRGT